MATIIDLSGNIVKADGFDGTVTSADVTALTSLGGTLTGTTDGTLADIAVPTDTPATADALRDDIATNMVPAINLQLKELQAKVNAIIAALKA